MRSRRDARLVVLAALLMLIFQPGGGTSSPNTSVPVVPGRDPLPFWSTDNVAAILEDGHVLLQSGRIARRSGTADLRTGESVTTLASSDGGLVAHKHAVKRADFPTTIAVASVGVEELFLFVDGAVLGVFYRNAEQVTRLTFTVPLPAAQVSGLPPAIGWSVDGKAFYIRLWELIPSPAELIPAAYYEIFTLSGRPPRGSTAVSSTHKKSIHVTATPTPYRLSGNIVYYTGMGTSAFPAQQQRDVSYVVALSESLDIYEVVTVLANESDVANDALGQIDAIFKASTGSIVYIDPMIAAYLIRKDTVLVGATPPNFELTVTGRITLLSWSDSAPSKRRWFSSGSIYESSSGGDLGIVESFYQSALFKAGVLTAVLGTGAEWQTGLATLPSNKSVRLGYAPMLVPSMSAERYVMIDTPSAWDQTLESSFDPVIRERVIALRNLPAASSTEVWRWRKSTDDAAYGIAPKLRGLQMLQPGHLYAFPESPWLQNIAADEGGAGNAGLETSYYDAENDPDPGNTLLPLEITILKEQQKFIATTGPFLAAPLKESPRLRGKGKLSTKTPLGFAAVLANAALPNPTAAQRVLVTRRAGGIK